MAIHHATQRIAILAARIAILLVISLAAAFAFDAGAAAGQTGITLSGWLHTVYGDAPAGGAHFHTHLLVDDTGDATLLMVPDSVIAAAGGRNAVNQRRVTVVGQMAPAPTMRTAAGLARLTVHAIYPAQPQPLSAPSEQAVSGSQKWVSILCRFADTASVTPYPKTWFDTLLLGSAAAPSLDHYWREVSLGNVDLTGSAVVGWYTLPQPRSYYVYGNPLQLDLQRAANDCTGVADADVYLPAYTGVNLMFNDDLDCCAWGGSTTITRDGQTRMYRVTWLPPWGYENQGPIAHEMGHGFGLPHSSGPYTATYDSRWDVMSDIWGNCPPYDPTYGCVGTHTISYHKDALGWIPGNRKYVASLGTSQTIALEPLDQPTLTGVLMAQIPIPGSSATFYTVETRRRVGYDGPLPGHAVVIHMVDTRRSDRDAQVVDPDANINPDDSGSMWLPGEAFVDSANGISVSVVGTTTSGFLVTVTNAPGGPTSYLLSVSVLGGPGTVTSNPAGIACSAGTCSASFPTGTSVTLTPGPGTLTAWGGACAGTGPCTVAMTADRSVSATFAALSPDITATPQEVTFGTVAVGSKSAALVTVRNDGGANLVLGTISLGGASPGHFALPSASDFCSGRTLGPGVSCSVEPRFKPKSAGVKNATLQIPSNDPDENPTSLTLTGIGSDPALPDITVTPLFVSFGSVLIGAKNVRDITVTNDGTANLLLGTATLNASTGELTLPGAQNFCTGMTLAPGQSCTIRVKIKATSMGPKSGTLSIPSNDPDESPVNVSVTATVN